MQEKQAQGHQHDRQQVEVVAGPQTVEPRQPPHPREVRVGHLRHALLAARDLVPLEADGPDDLREGQREHREVDAREPHAEEAEQQREGRGQHAGGGEGQQERHPGPGSFDHVQRHAFRNGNHRHLHG